MGSDLIEAWAAGWSAHDPERLVAVFREDCVYEDIPLGIVSRGREDLREFIRDWLRSSPDIVMRLQNTINTGAHAGAEWTFSGTQEGELADIAPTGRRFELRGASFFELDSEGISRCCDYWDLADLQRQLGQ